MSRLLRATFLLLLIASIGAGASPTPAEPQRPPASQPASAGDIVESNHRVTALTRRAVQLIDKKDWSGARDALLESLSLRPADPVNLYNLACVESRLDHTDASVTALERAARAGFTDFAQVERDPDLDSLRNLPRYKAFIDHKDEYQRRAAEGILLALRQHFGESYIYAIDLKQKLIFAAGVDAQTLGAIREHLQRQAESQAQDLFSHKPDYFISVIIPAPADFHKIIKQRNVGGVYFDAAKMLVAQKLGPELSHEFTHALHAADRAPLGQTHPMWLCEGLGVLYEGCGPDANGKIVPQDGPRMKAVRASAKRRALIPLERLLTLNNEEFMQRPTITYSEAGSLLYYLSEHGELRKFYDAYKAGYDADPTGKDALEKTTKMKIPELEATWMKWLVGKG